MMGKKKTTIIAKEKTKYNLRFSILRRKKCNLKNVVYVQVITMLNGDNTDNRTRATGPGLPIDIIIRNSYIIYGFTMRTIIDSYYHDLRHTYILNRGYYL